MMATHTTKGYQESCANFQTRKRTTPRDILVPVTIDYAECEGKAYVHPPRDKLGGTGNVCAYTAILLHGG
jgi:hypothetical protein